MINDSNSAVLELDDEFSSAISTDELETSASPAIGVYSKSTNRFAFVALLISVAGLLGALAWPLLSGQVYTADDLGWFHLPMRSFYSEQLAHGEAFDWCPDLYCGFYLTGEGQVGSYHPLHWLLYRTLPLAVAFNLECWLSYPLMLVGTYLFLRRWKLRPEAAGFGAMVFAFGSFNLLHLIHLNGIAIVAHLPWLLWAIDVMFRKPLLTGRGHGEWRRKRWLAFCGVALLTGSQLLLGYPQYVLFSLAVEAGYVFLLSCAQRTSLRTVASGLCRWLFAALLGAAIGAVQLLPTFDALQYSVRQENAAADFATQGSVPLLNLMQLVAPYLFATRVVGGITHEFGLYIGATPIVLAAWWVFGGRVRGGQHNPGNTRRRFHALTVAALITAGISLLWMMGELGPLGWLQEHLPLVNKFRLPCRAIVVFQLAVAVLASLGFAELLRPTRNPQQQNEESSSPETRSSRGQFLWLLPLTSAVFTLLALRFWLPYLGSLTLVALGPVMIAAAVCLVLRAAGGAHWAVAAIVLFAAIDLGCYGMSYSVFGHTEPLAKFISNVDVPPGLPPQRVALDLASGTEAAPGQKKVRTGDEITLAGWKRVDGYAGLDPAKQLDYRDPAALRAAGVTWLTAEAGTELRNSGHVGWMAKRERTTMVPSEPVFSTGKGGTLWMRLSKPQPRAWLVDKTIPTENAAADIAHISLAQEALVDKNAIALQPDAKPIGAATASSTSNKSSDTSPNISKPSGKVTMITDRPGNISLAVTCPTPQFLVVGESYHAGWQAMLDKQPAAVLRADGDFMGVAVGPGEHKIDWKFQPESLRYGRLTSAFGLSLIVAMLLTVAWPIRRRD
jgi:hypothetical protein